MGKLTNIIDKLKVFSENAENYINEHRWCSILINTVYLLTYLTVLIVLVFYSLALLLDDVNAQNIVTVVLAFSVFNNIFFKFF